MIAQVVLSHPFLPHSSSSFPCSERVGSFFFKILCYFSCARVHGRAWGESEGRERES